MNLLQRIFGKKPVCLYWYELLFTYRVNGEKIFDFTLQMGFKEHSDILNHRMIKKNAPRLDKSEKFKNLKRHLDNGIIQVSTVCFLGKFPNPNINQNKK